MGTSAKELVQQSETHRASKRFPEALASAMAATRADPRDANAWWQVALNRRDLGHADQAKAALLELIDLAPWFASGWVELGKIELSEGDIDEATVSFESALEYEDDNIGALSNLASIYEKRDINHEDKAAEQKVLEKLSSLGRANARQLNQLGRLHHAAGHYFDAIRCWTQAIELAPNAVYYFNLGLAYGTAEVAQHADAIDCFRQALKLDAFYERAKDQISRLLPAAIARAQVADRVGPTTLPEQAWYATYVNPYQLLNISAADVDEGEIPLEPKTLQRRRKRVLQEIELEDGTLSWMPALRIDRSRAISLLDELNDDELAWYHLYVYRDPKLLAFLSTGAHAHFLVDTNASPLEAIEHVNSDPAFLEWLGQYFAPQFDGVMSKAIAAANVELIEALAGGRRWVSAAQTDRCFESARRAVQRLLTPLKTLAGESDERLISAVEVQAVLDKAALAKCLDVLPVQFRDLQSEACEAIRTIALACNNEHGDPEEAESVLHCADALRFKSADLEHRIQGDFEQLKKLIANLNQHAFHFTPAGQRPWAITRHQILKAADSARPQDVFGVRWGATFSRVASGVQIDQEIAFWVDPGREIRFTLQDVRTSAAETRTEQRFKAMMSAALNYVVPVLVDRLEAHLKSGAALQIGPCRLTREGAAYETRGLIFSKENFVAWRDMHTDMRSGAVHIASRSGAAKPIILDMRTQYNAAMVPLIKAAMTGEG